MSRSALLFDLQDVDLAFAQRQRELEQLQEEMASVDELGDVVDEEQEAEALLRETERSRGDLEAEVHAGAERIQREEQRAYSGRVVIPKELASLNEDIRHGKARKAEQEEELLATLIRLEEVQERVAEARRQVEAARRQAAERKAELVRQQEEIEGRLNELREQRRLRAEQVDTPSMRIYEHLRETRQGRAVARLEQGTCGGCRIVVPTTDVQRARNGDLLVQCPSCRRILHAV